VKTIWCHVKPTGHSLPVWHTDGQSDSDLRNFIWAENNIHNDDYDDDDENEIDTSNEKNNNSNNNNINK